MILEFKIEKHEYSTSHKSSVKALEGVELSIPEGSFTCLVGPSGSGKSTLLNMAAGFIKPTSGFVYHKGKPVYSPSADRAVVFQEESLFPWMTIRDNIYLALKQKGVKGKAAHLEMRRLFDLVGIEGFDDAYPSELSMGMRQKVSIARGLALSDSLLLMDEPFSALDEKSRARLNRELLDIWKKKKITILFITHSIDEAIHLGTRITLLSARPGRVVKTWQNIDECRGKGSPEYEGLKKEIMTSMELCCPGCQNQEIL